MGLPSRSLRSTPSRSTANFFDFHRFEAMAAPKLAGTALRELRIHLCQKSAASAGVREFVQKSYDPLKTANPKLPIMIRECSGIQPKLWARFTYGQESSADLTNKSSEQVMQAIKQLVK